MSGRKKRKSAQEELAHEDKTAPPRRSLSRKCKVQKAGEDVALNDVPVRSIEEPQRKHNDNQDVSGFDKLSMEILCEIISYLPLRDIVRIECLSKRVQEAIDMHLRILKDINFSPDPWKKETIGRTMNDDNLVRFLSRCVDVERIYGFFPNDIQKRRTRGVISLSIPGCIAALSACRNLQGIEISSIALLDAIIHVLPWVEILNTFKNRDGGFPPSPLKRLCLSTNPKISRLDLYGVTIPELPQMDNVSHLFLRCVRFTAFQPFSDFFAPRLNTFVMENCAGLLSPLRCISLVSMLAAARGLQRLELVRVPFLGGLFQHVVETTWRRGAFRSLKKIKISTCKLATEMDLGFLILAAANRVEELEIQPSLSKDGLFLALEKAESIYPMISSVYLGFEDPHLNKDFWSTEELIAHGLADMSENPALITDVGVKTLGSTLVEIERITLHNCPHIHKPDTWQLADKTLWRNMKSLTLYDCHGIKLDSLCQLVPQLPALEHLVLWMMFKQPPKGCSRFGLTAGAVVAEIQDPPLLNGNHHGLYIGPQQRRLGPLPHGRRPADPAPAPTANRGRRNSAPAADRGRNAPRRNTTEPSDPREEEDLAQVLTVTSDTLNCVEISCTGLTDIVLKDCPSLTKFIVDGAHVLKNADFKGCERLREVHMCPESKKMNFTKMLKNVQKMAPQTSRHITIKCNVSKGPSIEDELFTKKDTGYNVLLCKTVDCCHGNKDSHSMWLCTLKDIVKPAQKWLFDRVHELEGPLQKDLLRRLQSQAVWNSCSAPLEIKTDMPWLNIKTESKSFSESMEKLEYNWSADDLIANFPTDELIVWQNYRVKENFLTVSLNLSSG